MSQAAALFTCLPRCGAAGASQHKGTMSASSSHEALAALAAAPSPAAHLGDGAFAGGDAGGFVDALGQVVFGGDASAANPPPSSPVEAPAEQAPCRRRPTTRTTAPLPPRWVRRAAAAAAARAAPRVTSPLTCSCRRRR